MDKRSILALVLIALVLFGGQLLMPHAPTPPIGVDSLAASTTPPPPAPVAKSATTKTASVPTPPQPAPSVKSAAPPAIPTDTIAVAGAGRVAQLTSVGAALVRVTLPDYQDLKRRNGALTIVSNSGPLLRYRIVTGGDTVDLSRIPFTVTRTERTADFVSNTPAVTVHYELMADHFITHTAVSMPGASPGAQLLIDLGTDLRSGEADTTEDLRHLAYGFRRVKDGVESAPMAKLDTTTWRVEAGPLDWVALRNKYFLVAAIATDSAHQFSGMRLRGGSRRTGGGPTGLATATLPLSNGSARFDLYTGPQSWTSLQAIGHEMVNVNPYAGWSWLRPVVQPFATIVMRLLLGLKAAVGLSYGWVLVIFGIVIRLVLWPLNQTAMKTSIKMQKLQPELAALQKRYAKDPEGQRAAMVKLYQQHEMSPFSPLMGCLPMLLPMPILFALYFVFQNTIEFRGVSFLWLPDISLRDPYYITPLAMGVSMLVLSWIGMRSAPSNPQAKVMGYMMPAMFTIMFLNFASGLNLYYAVQNLVAIPQQWLLTRQRARASGEPPTKPPR